MDEQTQNFQKKKPKQNSRLIQQVRHGIKWVCVYYKNRQLSVKYEMIYHMIRRTSFR